MPQVSHVLIRALILNPVVTVRKIGFGYASGAISILPDGFHSLTDAASNLVGLVGVRAAGRPPDEDRAYGHRKYETVAAAAVAVFLLLVMIEVLRNAFNHLTGRAAPHETSVASFVVMIVTVGINLMVSAYESCYRKERRRTDCQRSAGEILPVQYGDFWGRRDDFGAICSPRFRARRRGLSSKHLDRPEIVAGWHAPCVERSRKHLDSVEVNSMPAVHAHVSRPRLILVGAALVTLVVLSGSRAEAIPAWSRKYETSCSTCHAVFPKLNYFGKAFRNNGYRFPGGEDGTATKQTLVSLGADAYKKLFPRALWPSDIPGAVPLAVRGIARFNTFEDAQTTTFEFPHEFEVLTGGTLGETFSFFGELEVENEANENDLGMGLMLQYDPRPWLHVRMGTVAVHPIADALRLTAAHYSAYDTRTTPSSRTLTAPNPNRSTATLSISATTGEDRWRFREDQAGVEVWGARNGPNNHGGLTWSVGLGNGQGLIDANDHKDVFARAAYKFGGYGELGGGELSQDLEFWRDDSFKVGAFTYVGKSTNIYSIWLPGPRTI